MGVVVTSEAEDKAADRVGGVDAVGEEFIPVCVAGDGLVVLEGGDEVREGGYRQRMFADGGGEGDEDGMGSALVEHTFEFGAPPMKEAEAFGGVADLISKVVGPTADGVDVVEFLMQALMKL